MKKVLLVTLQGLFNYGNRLQNYALQTVLEGLGCQVDNLTVVRPSVSKKQELHTLAQRVLVRLGVNRYRYHAAASTRSIRMAEFNRTHIHGYIFLNRREVDTYDFSRYDAAVVGSDQVWHNWHRMERELSFYYLSFMDEKKRIAYAPSFGFTTFPPEDLEEHRHGLMGMASLSCREREGCELIRTLTGRPAEKVLDPTLLLSAEEWQKNEKRPRFRVPDRYLLQFMLGQVPAGYMAEMLSIAKERNLQVLNINQSSDYRRYGLSPAEFIWLIHHADVVCTDSFHATVFTVSFGRNLRVFERMSTSMGHMFGRLHELLESLGLADNIVGSGERLSTELSDEAREFLQGERERSLQYLRDSLSRV